MLSISKLVAGQARYHLDQATGRVDVVESVGDGVEEYYAGGSEARGQWLGAGAAGLDLAGPVDGPALRSVLAAIDPSDDSELRGSASPVRVAGYDLTFSAPTSVSVLFGIGDAGARAAIRHGHDRAVHESLDYLERSAAAVRRGHGGVRVEPADGFVAAAFRHRTSRAGDPQLHTHVLVANLGRGPDGRWSALDGRRLYAHARTASFVYQAVLRDELSRTLGLEWTPVCEGIAEVPGVPKPILRAFSRRRAEIDAALQERGTSGARAAEAAALATRQPKSHALDGNELQASWRERAAQHGFAQEDVHRVLGRESERRVDALALERAFGAMASPLGLTRRASTFNRRDVIQGLCERLPLKQAAELRRAIEAGAVLRDRRGRRVRPPGPAMIRRLISCLATILDEAVDDRYLERNPARSRRMRIKVAKPARTFLEMDELVALTDAAGEQDARFARPKLAVAPPAGSTAAQVGERWSTGMRASDIAEELGLSKPTITYHLRRLRAEGPATYIGRRAIVATLGGSGIRVSELCDMRVRDLRLHAASGAHFRIPDAKTEAGIREVQVSPDLLEELVAHLDRLQRGGLPTQPDAYLFANVRGGRMTRQRANAIVCQAAELASTRLAARGLPALPNTTPHTLRRTYISVALLANRFDVLWVMRQVGHADSKMTLDVYAQLQQRAERQHGEAFDALARRARERLYGTSTDGETAPTGDVSAGPLRTSG